MNVLMGKVKRSDGELLINGVSCEMERFRKIIGFVPQEDVMLRELTVRENILHSARCRLPNTWTISEINEYVDNIIKVLK
jgi:ABC-type multidrug transport system ATPase subunit